MSNPLEYRPSSLTKSVWVFWLDVDPEQLKPWIHEAFPADEDAETIWPLRDALGLKRLENDFTEVFDAADMQEYGLARYLTESNGFAEDSVAADAARLDALDGPVALIYSEALGDEPVTFDPSPPLEFIGRYDTKPDLRLANPIDTDAGEGVIPAAPPAEPAGKRSLGAILTATALLVLALILMWLFL